MKKPLCVKDNLNELRVPLRRQNKVPHQMINAFLAGLFSPKLCEIILYDEVYNWIGSISRHSPLTHAFSTIFSQPCSPTRRETFQSCCTRICWPPKNPKETKVLLHLGCMERRRLMRSSIGGWVLKRLAKLLPARGLTMNM